MTRKPSPFPDETRVVGDPATVPEMTWAEITSHYSTVDQSWWEPANICPPEPAEEATPWPPVNEPGRRIIRSLGSYHPNTADALASTTLLSTVITDPVELETPHADEVTISGPAVEVENPHLYAALEASYPVLTDKQRAEFLVAHGVSKRAAKERDEYWTELSRVLAAEPLEGPFWNLPDSAMETLELLFATPKRKGASDEVTTLAAAA